MEEIAGKMLDVRLKMASILQFCKKDLSLNEDSIICASCTDNIHRFFEFKSVCLCTEDRIAPLIGTMDSTKVEEIEVLYLKENSDYTIINPDDDICRLCLRKGHCVDLNAINAEFAEDIAAKCIPEVDLTSTHDPKICLPCRTSLESYYLFVTKCLAKQKRITKCSEFNPCLDIKEELDMKMDDDECDGNGRNSVSLTYSNLILPVDSEIKPWVCEAPDTKTTLITFKHDPDQSTSKIKVEDPNCDGLIEDISKVPTSQRYSARDKIAQKYVRRRNLSIHLDASGIKTYHCRLCAFKTKWKGNANQHLLTHQSASKLRMYKCRLCSYKSKWKAGVTTHMLIHKDASKTTMYQCDVCSFKTKWKVALERHMKLHRESPKGAYQCKFCPYNAKTKFYLNRHMLTHRDGADAPTYQCTLCPHKTKRKEALTRHMLLHEDLSGAATLECTLCPYKTKREMYLKRHLLTHQDTTTYECDRCSFKTKWKFALKRHMLNHKGDAEAKAYECECCVYKTKWKSALKRHMLSHTDDSEVRAYECECCPFKTKWKDSLKSHMLNHKDDSEVKAFECDCCPFKTIWKHALKAHILKHKDGSKTKDYECECCPFKTKWKYALQRHMLNHENS
ncbi:hypothetical protein NQ318_012055 [Aromia moschata]|uniref:C2H2-type domain-containing protein n=1 Tax=Aromia moschata TaxID=1265417 RepID=A0AAV8XLK7_9CUCU|nr:hypothetical protein NQ318_012055 [Aromia moschata]